MKTVFAFASAMFLITSTACVSDTHEIAGADLLIRDVVIVSPERKAPSRPTNVWVSDGRIVKITSKTPPTDATTVIIEGQGMFLSPGYVDAHVHLSAIPGMRFDQEQANPDVSEQARSQIPRSYLYHGFTTLIDVAADAKLAERWNDKDIAPTVHYCGALTIQDGYPTAFIPKPQRYEVMPNFIFDSSRAEEFPDGFNRNDHSPERLVEKIADDGAICVKSFLEAGFGGQSLWPTPSEEILRRIKAAANKRDIPFVLHANSEMAQSTGVAIELDAFVHGMWTWNGRDTDVTASVRRVLDGVIEKKIGWQPTIQVLYGERDLHDPDYLTQPDLQHVAPQILIDWYASEDGQWYRDVMASKPFVKGYLDNDQWQEIDRVGIHRVNAAFKYLDDNGGHLMFGSDTPSDLTFANPPGLNGWREMERWLNNGVTPAKLFKAATLDNARFFGLDDEIGTVEIGKRADLLVLEENPLEDAQALNKIRIVIVEGHAIERNTLSAINH